MLKDISSFSKAILRRITGRKPKFAIAGALYNLCKSETVADFDSFTTYSSVESEDSITAISITTPIQSNDANPLVQQVELVNEQDIQNIPSLSLPSAIQIDDKPPVPPSKLPKPLSISGRRYSLLAELGKGSHGKVMLATDNLQIKDVAIKVIKKQPLAIDCLPLTDDYYQCHREPIRVSDVTTEIQLLKAASEIGSPFVTSFEYAFQDVDYCYLVMPLLAQSLEDRLGELAAKHTEMHLPDIRIYAADILLGLEALHSHGIYHCDLKPGNIMLGLDGHALIVDMSVAQQCSGILRGFRGTPGFVAPEIDIDDWYSASVADIYSYGMVLFCMFLCPSTPLNSWYKVCMNIDASPHAAWPEVRDLVERLLDPNPHKRAPIGQIKRHDFFRYLKWNEVLDKEYLLGYTPPHPRTRLSDTPTDPQ